MAPPRNSPTVRPSASMSTLCAAGVLPKPGICWIAPQSGHEPARAGVGADVANRELEVRRGSESSGSAERESGVLAMHDGQMGEPLIGELLDLSLRLEVVDDLGPRRTRGCRWSRSWT
jgi:hypothetical protein